MRLANALPHNLLISAKTPGIVNRETETDHRDLRERGQDMHRAEFARSVLCVSDGEEMRRVQDGYIGI
jgi:hypothetical protein